MAGVDSAPPEPASDEIKLSAPPFRLPTSPNLTRVRAALARSDPPLGFMPDFTFRSPVMSGAAARWKKGGGSEGLLRIMRCVRQGRAARTSSH